MAPGWGGAPRSSPRPAKPGTWRRRSSGLAATRPWKARRSPVNTGASWPTPGDGGGAGTRGSRSNPHKWATGRSGPEVQSTSTTSSADPATLLHGVAVGFAATRAHAQPEVDGQTAYHVEAGAGVEASFLDRLRELSFARGAIGRWPVRERMIPKRGGKRRRLGTRTLADRVVQAALKTVLEPIFEVDSQAALIRVSVRDAEHRTRSPRSTTSPAALTSGLSRLTSRRASIASTTGP